MPSKKFGVSDSKLRRSQIERQHVSAWRENNKLPSLFIFSFFNFSGAIQVGYVSNFIHRVAGERRFSYQMCVTRSWLQRWKASCSIYHIQMSSPLEIVWSRKNECIWSPHTDDWFCNRGNFIYITKSFPLLVRFVLLDSNTPYCEIHWHIGNFLSFFFHGKA